MIHILYRIYGYIRRFLFSALRIKTVGVRALIVRNQKVLLVRHTYIDGWYLPGGGVNACESAVQAVVREVKEEVAGSVTKPVKLLGVYYNPKHGWDDYVVLYKLDLANQGKIVDREIAEASWFNVNDLPDDITMSTKKRINEHVFGDQVDELW